MGDVGSTKKIDDAEVPYLREVKWAVNTVVSMAFVGLGFWVIVQFIVVLHCLPLTKGWLHD